MEAILSFFDNLPDLVGAEVYQGLRWAILFGPAIGWVVWPFFGRNGDRVLSWALGGLLSGGILGAALQFTTFLAGMRQATAIYEIAQNEGVGVAAFMSMAVTAATGAGIGLLLAVAVQELQRAFLGAFYGIFVGLAVAIGSLNARSFKVLSVLQAGETPAVLSTVGCASRASGAMLST